MLLPSLREAPVSLQQQITDDLKSAMKAREKARTQALRMLTAALKNAAIESGGGPQAELSDEQVQRVVASEVKRRREAAAAYRDGDRQEQAEAEEAEADVYSAYLPEPLSDDELTEIIDEEIAAAGAEGPGDMGPVMKAVMGRVGSRAEGSQVSALVKQRLAG